ncbi:type II toxin-antitoxin system VapC family toxin [Pseudonocardia sp. DSM 110487]|uniref:type II toxin-antitoxin system VapC family toxin n=1 Tax=Pseudonocardia sp. DSM 110487 TaxID=2865833 RepID=UPI001C6A0B9E|nr:type II toxin-antitoxin system VapC family toxin [Pseudonocardia sp. DSM 110487]QYN35889.1 type II toxin-antitoxin system VapC family toxin [Pseudonocardia sp. DSM 110487]
MKGLLATSVFIALESGRPLDEQRIPDETAVSVVTLAELQAGVLAATDIDVRARRLATLDAVADIELIDIDESAARAWARMRVHLAGTGRRVNVNDLWIAAVAASRGLPVVTQDDDFGPVEGVMGLDVIRV